METKKIISMNETIDRLKTISIEYRQKIIELANTHSFGIHMGGSLSLAEILTVLYFSVAQVDPLQPDWPDRDRIILSKGHANVGLMTMLAMKGYFSFDAFDTFNQVESPYTMHPDPAVPGIEHATGSLGHGLSVGVGLALAGRLDGKDYHTYCILGDGESMEGSVWEAIMSAAHFKLDNLTVILDRNRLSQESQTEDLIQLEPLDGKYRMFGWNALRVDGHDIDALLSAFKLPHNGKPKAIIAETRKGRGVSDYENLPKSHFAHLSDEEFLSAQKMIEAQRQKINLRNNYD